eukprot:Hpha_TRINITY_DN16959_c1_g5::TRINITY_DN16959_c1_g5_i1::g.56595::m.56595
MGDMGRAALAAQLLLQALDEREAESKIDPRGPGLEVMRRARALLFPSRFAPPTLVELEDALPAVSQEATDALAGVVAGRAPAEGWLLVAAVLQVARARGEVSSVVAEAERAALPVVSGSMLCRCRAGVLLRLWQRDAVGAARLAIEGGDTGALASIAHAAGDADALSPQERAAIATFAFAAADKSTPSSAEGDAERSFVVVPEGAGSLGDAAWRLLSAGGGLSAAQMLDIVGSATPSGEVPFSPAPMFIQSGDTGVLDRPLSTLLPALRDAFGMVESPA